MRGVFAPWVTVGGMLVLAIVVAFSASQIATIDGKIGELVAPRNQQQEQDMDPLTTTVTNKDGIEITVETTKRADENDAQQLARHLARVALAQNSGSGTEGK